MEWVLRSLNLVVLRGSLAEKVVEFVQISIQVTVKVESCLEVVSERRLVGTH